MVPSLFVAHGSPMLAVEDNDYTRFLYQVGGSIPRPRAIVLFSAHWVTSAQKVSEVESYQTIYDFGGFPDALYRIQYPARGSGQIAREIEDLFGEHGVHFEPEQTRGLDHGAWVVLSKMYPDASVPVISMSVNPQLAPEEQYNIGRAISAIRAKDILVIGSGGTVHNLRAVNFQDNGQIDDWALDFDKWLEQQLNHWDLQSLFQYESLAPTAKMAVPPYGNEHFVPIFYAMGAADDAKQAKLLHRSYQYGNLSHSVWQFG
jgi:4,5-DOPA dioxygenase extradiol